MVNGHNHLSAWLQNSVKLSHDMAVPISSNMLKHICANNCIKCIILKWQLLGRSSSQQNVGKTFFFI